MRRLTYAAAARKDLNDDDRLEIVKILEAHREVEAAIGKIDPDP